MFTARCIASLGIAEAVSVAYRQELEGGSVEGSMTDKFPATADEKSCVRTCPAFTPAARIIACVSPLFPRRLAAPRTPDPKRCHPAGFGVQRGRKLLRDDYRRSWVAEEARV